MYSSPHQLVSPVKDHFLLQSHGEMGVQRIRATNFRLHHIAAPMLRADDSTTKTPNFVRLLISFCPRPAPSKIPMEPYWAPTDSFFRSSPEDRAFNRVGEVDQSVLWRGRNGETYLTFLTAAWVPSNLQSSSSSLSHLATHLSHSGVTFSGICLSLL